MQTKRSKRSRIRAAKDTSGHGSKKKHRGAGHRGGRGISGSGKRGDAKLMKVTKGERHLGKYGFISRKKKVNAINLQTLQESLIQLVDHKKVSVEKDVYEIDLGVLGFERLLSKGRVTKKMHIKVRSVSEKAISKIKAAGGEVAAQNIEENK
jgi:large subunit ribosomal protein L15